MPIYEYRCERCGKHFEVIQKFSDKPLEKCSSCGGVLTKLISQTSFQLKGSGWYATDYAGKTKTAKTDDKAAPATESTAKDSTTKPEPASSAKTETEKPSKS